MQHPRPMQVRFGVLMGFLVSFSVAAVSAEELSRAGIYILSEVNSQQLPALTWITNADGKKCRDETLEGGLFMDRDGRAVAFTTERMTCVDSSGKAVPGQEVSTLWAATYEVSANNIAILFENFNDADKGVFDGERLILTSVGAGDFEGQTSEFVFHKQ